MTLELSLRKTEKNPWNSQAPNHRNPMSQDSEGEGEERDVPWQLSPGNRSRQSFQISGHNLAGFFLMELEKEIL
ncbi:rCG48825 [Rattus norvegicus]|uniref:RCG48825 n=1 Tax=Rattus norvegicus TaxID=10116 RepID=A6IGV9_RAT|nr:rCG48825 [Rattus norvegicus]